MDVLRALESFEFAVGEARANRSKKQAIGPAFRQLLIASGKTKAEIVVAIRANRATIDRWVNGARVPQNGQMVALGRYFRATQSGLPQGLDTVASLLVDPKYRLLLEFILETQKANPLSKEQVANLFWFAGKSEKPPSLEMLRTFIGL